MGCGLAMVSCLAALGLTLALLPYLGSARLSLFLGAVLLTTWIGGGGPGVAAILITLVLADVYVMPAHSHSRLAADIHVPLAIYMGIASLITALMSAAQRAARNLRASEHKFRAVFEKSQEAILVSQAGQHVFMNPAYLALFGYQESPQLVGHSILRLIAPEQREHINERIQRRERGEPVPARYESRGLRRDGTEFDLEIDVSAIELHGKRYSLVLVRDITDRKYAEQKAVSQSQELEKKVTRRTEQLKAANRELEAFAFSVAHDLRAPLRHIGGYLDMIMEDHFASMPPEARQLFEQVQDGAGKMDQLVKDLLSFSRLTGQEVNKTFLDMANLAAAVGRELLRLEKDRAIQFSVKDVPTANADPVLLRQVLVNLIGNSIKFTRHVAQPAIEISGWIEGQDCFCSVRDNGIGFDMKQADKLFQVFQRLHPQEDYEGSGVGLAIVQRIIRRHGGRVWAEATLNQGACFYFSLPLGDTRF